MMRATEINPGYYEVRDGDKWYTASHRGDGNWLVINHLGQAIKYHSAIHDRVVSAIHGERD